MAQPEANRVAIHSSVSAVTVYSDRAAVTRVGEADLHAGTYLLSIENLPEDLLDNSVRVSGKAEEAKILDVRVETSFLDTVSDERIAALHSQLEDLQSKQQEVRDRIAVVTDEKEFVLEIKAQSSADISKDLKIQRPNVEDWQKVIGFIDSNLNTFYDEIRKLTKEKDDLQVKIETVQRQIAAITPRRDKEVKSIVATVDVIQPGEVQLAATYVVTGAWWNPSYEVRVGTESKKVVLNYFGTVRQSTGEDWSNVDLSLSTARPEIGGKKPELLPWYLSVPPSPRMESQALMMKQGAATDQAVTNHVYVSGEKMKAVEVIGASVESQAASVLFHVSVPVSVPADNSPHKVLITSASLQADFSYSSAPKVSPFVYLTSAIKNTTDYPFLAGPVNIFSNDEFVGTSSIKTVAPNETFDASLGIDPSITIQRKLVNKFTEYTGTFTKSTRVTYEYQFTVENHKTTAEQVTVQDQIPVSQNEKIVVQLIEPSPDAVKKDDQGILTWNLDLKSFEKKEFTLKFSVEYPRELSVSGLE